MAPSSNLSLGNFITSIADVQDKPVKKVLERVCAFYGLCNMMDDNWSGFLDRQEAIMVKQAVVELLKVLRPGMTQVIFKEFQNIPARPVYNFTT